MRGRQEPQVTMLAFVDLDARVPPDHPLRIIKALADQALAALSPEPTFPIATGWAQATHHPRRKPW